MRILVTDLTRMADGHICVAGIDLESGRRVRPVMTYALDAALTSTCGGPFDLRRVIDLGETLPMGTPPEIEDVHFRAGHAKHVQTIIGTAFLERLRAAAVRGLDAFGPELAPAGQGGRAMPEHAGPCSLIITRAAGPFEVCLSERGTLRARWPNGLDLSVTDIRLYRDDLRTPDPLPLGWLRRRLAEGGEVYLCFGLSRPFRRSSDDRPRHWLQLNNIHLAAAPDWQLRWPRERYRD